MRIRQARVSGSIPHFDGKFHRRYGLSKYEDQSSPAVFLGCYSKGDVDAISDHASLAVLVWGGSDAASVKDNPEKFSRVRSDGIVHIAQSSFIHASLLSAGIESIQLPINSADHDLFKPAPLGDSVYCYCPYGAEDKYGGPLLRKVIEMMPGVKFIVNEGVPNGVPHGEMPEQYGKCFIGLRLTEHDGLAHTVTEMGLMGRMCVWNGEAPNSIPYRNASDIVEAIRRIGFCRPDPRRVSGSMRRFLDIGDGWLNTEHYAGQATSGCGSSGGDDGAAVPACAPPVDSNPFSEKTASEEINANV